MTRHRAIALSDAPKYSIGRPYSASHAMLGALHIALLIYGCVMAYRIATTIYRASDIFREFKQPKMLALAVMLFPLGPLVLLGGASRLLFPLAFIGAAACYVPALFIARRLGHALERAGTDRVKEAQGAVSQAFGTALIGLVYVAFFLVIAITVAESPDA